MAILRSLDDQIHIPIDEGHPLLVGRMETCNIQIDDDSVSSQHAQIHLENNVLKLKDVGSTNGTRVNYVLIDEPVVLLHGDTVEFGGFSFTVDGQELRETDDGDHENVFEEFQPVGAHGSSATMRLELDLEEVDLHDTQPRIPPKPSQSTPPVVAQLEPADPPPKAEIPVKPFSNPVGVAFALALVILLLSGALLLLQVNTLPLPF